MPKEELQVTTVAEHRNREPEGFLTKCPSGLVVKMRRTLDLHVLLKSGRIPNPLATIVQSMIDRGDVELDPSKVEGKAMQQMLAMVDECVVKAVIAPKIILLGEGDELPEDALDISEVDPDDRMFIYSVAQGGAADLDNFRAQQDRVMASVPDVKRVPAATKRTTKRK